MTFKTQLPHQEYRDVLMDFRHQLFHRFLWVILVIFVASINISLLFQPRPFLLLGTLVVLISVFWLIRELYFHRPNIARYSFVVMLYLSLFAIIWVYREPWILYLITAVLLISALLMSNSTLIGAVSFCGYILWLDDTGYELPVSGIIILTIISYSVIFVAISTFNTALSWYSSMHRHADKLLDESRERRAELLQTLKSLGIAYKTQRSLQQQLIHTRQEAEDARRMKERFASNISHELRTPLNIILGFSEIMHLTPEVYGNVFFSPKLHRDIYQIYHNSKHLLAMIDDVLDLSHIEMSEFSLNFEPTDLNLFLKDIVDMLEHHFEGSDVCFKTNFVVDLPKIEIDRTRIRQVLINLITNARRFTDQGYVSLTVETLNNYVQFSVEDTGRGIEADKIGLVFEEFYQVDYSLSRQHGGAGLGLSITKQFVEAHNGSIHVTSEYGHGSNFIFTLPLPEHHRAIYHYGANWSANGDAADKNAILLVDSDPHTASLIARHLDAYQIVQVNDVADIQEQVLQYNPVIVIYNRLSEQDPLPTMSIPVIECTLPSSQWFEHSLNVDMSLAKPISPQQIADILSQYPHVKKLLIVDDEIGFVQLIQRSIEQLETSYHIRRAYDGIQAYDIIQEDPPELIFLDLAMPEMDGFELIEKLQSDGTFHQIPIVLLTATRHLKSDSDWLPHIKIHKQGGFSPYQTLSYIKKFLTT